MKEKIEENKIDLLQKIVLSPRCVAHRRDSFVIEYLDEIETEFENTLVCLSGAQMSSNYEEKKISDTLPLGYSKIPLIARWAIVVQGKSVLRIQNSGSAKLSWIRLASAIRIN